MCARATPQLTADMLITLLIMAYSPMDGYSRQVTATCRRWGITTNMFYVSVGAAIMALSSLALASERAVPPPALQFLQALTIPCLLYTSPSPRDRG